MDQIRLSRRAMLASLAAGAAMVGTETLSSAGPAPPRKSRIAITLDLEMCRNFPTWETTHWDYEKGNLDADTKAYALEAAKRVKDRGGVVHFFCVGQVLEQENLKWLEHLAAEGHKVGNHTYDHVNLLATKPEDVQFRFRRAPWLMRGRPPNEVIADNVRMCNEALHSRIGIDAAGFRTPGGFAAGLDGREDLQRMLLAQGFKWVSSKYPNHAYGVPGERPGREVFDDIIKKQATAQPFVYPTGLIEIPISPITDIGAFRNGRWPLQDYLTAIRRAVEWAVENRAVFDYGAHPSCLLAADPQFKAIDLVCDLVEAARDRAGIVDLSTVAAAVS